MGITKQQLLQHLREQVYCCLGVSSISGVGVFAIRRIPKGIEPLRALTDMDDLLFTHAEIKNLPKSVRDQIDKFCYYDTKHVHIPLIGLNSARLGVYLNHSKTPNIQYNAKGQLEAMRSIKKGEELLMDYDINFGGIHSFD